jgi:hypothetical protein
VIVLRFYGGLTTEEIAAIDSGRILFVVESVAAGGAESLRVIKGDSMESVPIDDPNVARAAWAGGSSVVFDTAAPPDRQVFRLADYHEFVPIQSTGTAADDNLGRAVTGVSADGSHLMVGQWTVVPNAPSGFIELNVADGTSVPRLDDAGRGCGQPDVSADDASWSPDGTLLTFVCISDGDSRTGSVAVAHPDGSEHRTLTDDFAGIGVPKFSPDGTRSCSPTAERWTRCPSLAVTRPSCSRCPTNRPRSTPTGPPTAPRWCLPGSRTVGTTTNFASPTSTAPTCKRSGSVAQRKPPSYPTGDNDRRSRRDFGGPSVEQLPVRIVVPDRIMLPALLAALLNTTSDVDVIGPNVWDHRGPPQSAFTSA